MIKKIPIHLSTCVVDARILAVCRGRLHLGCVPWASASWLCAVGVHTLAGCRGCQHLGWVPWVPAHWRCAVGASILAAAVCTSILVVSPWRQHIDCVPWTRQHIACAPLVPASRLCAVDAPAFWLGV